MVVTVGCIFYHTSIEYIILSLFAKDKIWQIFDWLKRFSAYV